MGNDKTPQYNGELWERMLGESAKQYEKFCAYRDMRYSMPSNGSELAEFDICKKRSIRVLAKTIGISHKPLEPLSTKFHWVERCEAYDTYMLERIRLKNEADIIAMKRRHAGIASRMILKATQRLLTIPEDEISASEIVRLVDIGVKIERLSRGESTEKQEISGEAKIHHSGEFSVKSSLDLDLSKLSDEELGQLEQLLVKLHQEPVI